MSDGGRAALAMTLGPAQCHPRLLLCVTHTLNYLVVFMGKLFICSVVNHEKQLRSITDAHSPFHNSVRSLEVLQGWGMFGCLW